jgi:hypothetical protein
VIAGINIQKTPCLYGGAFLFLRLTKRQSTSLIRERQWGFPTLSYPAQVTKNVSWMGHLYFNAHFGDSLHSNAQPPLYSVTATISSLSPCFKWIDVWSLRPKTPRASSARYESAFFPEKI